MHSILEEADKIIDGVKREEYGDLCSSFSAIARIWSDILETELQAEDVALMMIAMKVLRQANKHKRDNLVDIAGYTKCLALLIERRGNPDLVKTKNHIGLIKKDSIITHMVCEGVHMPIKEVINLIDQIRLLKEKF